MKKQLLFMAVAGLFTSMASATDLIVRDGGAGGAYSSISAAITAANDGDRIIIRPKTGNVPYQENINVDKSLTFVTEIAGDKYEINGNFTVNAANDRVVTIQDASMVNGTDIIAGGTALTGRMTLNILNCLVADDISVASAGVTANIVNTTCDMIFMVHGKVVSSVTKKITVSDDTSTTPSTDDLYIIANKITYPAHGVQETAAIIYNSSKYEFHILNNFIDNAQGPGMFFGVMKSGTTNEIINNFIFFQVSNGVGITVSSSQVATVNIVNNAFDTISYQYVIDASSSPYVMAQYNILEAGTLGTNFAVNGLDFTSNNISGPYNFSSTTGLATGTIVDGGFPDNIYADIDLTRGDMGPTGGSYAWSNYWTGVTAKPHVFFLETPRTIYTGTTTFPANGNATTR